MATREKKDVYQIITDLVIDRLEKGNIPWKQPWNAFGPASNYLTKKPYQGINFFILNSLAHEYPFYLTFKQASDLGGKVKKGSKSIPVTYWNFIYTDKETKKRISLEEAKKLPSNRVVKSAFLKYYSVFNISDVEGVDFKFSESLIKENSSIEGCERIINNMPSPPKVQHQGKDAYYSPLKDFINMPEMKFFRNSETYYSILFHELTHSTGHAKRLARTEIIKNQAFGSDSYSKEELTAEMGACFLTNFAGIQSEDTVEHSAAYIENWLSVFKNDKKFVIEAAGKAQKAVDYILNIKKGD